MRKSSVPRIHNRKEKMLNRVAQKMIIRIPTPSLLTYLNGHKPKISQLTIIDLNPQQSKLATETHTYTHTQKGSTT